MNQRKILALAVAATLMAPMTTYADVKLSGVIQAEMGGATLGRINGEEVDTVRVSKDSSGALLNGGPNHLRFDVDEKLGGGLTAYGRYQVSFDTAVNTGLVKGQEAWVGLKTSGFLLRFGKLEGNYRSSKGLIDPFAGTAIQARATAGGMSGDKYLGMNGTMMTAGKSMDISEVAGGYHIDKQADGKYTVWAPWWSDDPTTPGDERVVAQGVDSVSLMTNAGAPTYDSGLAHSGYVNNALEVGLKFGGFSASFQGVFDETDALDGAGLIELRYSAPEDVFTLFAAASYLDFGDFSNTIKNTTKSSDKQNNESAKNWKIGGQFKMAGVTLGLQYEDAEIGAFDPNPDGGNYILGSLDYKINNVAIGGWVAGYMSDAEDEFKWRVNGELINEDAINWAVGVKYFFSKRTLAYLGYLQTDSDNNYRDQKAYGLGLRHAF